MSINPYEPPTKPVAETLLPQQRMRALAVVSLLIYITAFLLPVFDSGTPQVMYGYEAFLFAVLSVRFIPTWLANPLYWMAFQKAWKGNAKAARPFAIASVLLAISQLWMMDDAPEAGFYLWSGSMAILGIGTSVFIDWFNARLTENGVRSHLGEENET